MEPEDAALMAEDVPGTRFGLKEGRDAREHVKTLQFFDFAGEESEPSAPSLGNAAQAIFKRYEHIVEVCAGSPP